MGIKPATALKIALFASPFLILWSVLPWANLVSYGDFGGGAFAQHIAGTDVRSVAPFGDGVAVILLALMSITLAGLGLYSPDSRRIAGFGLVLAGTFAAGIAVYDIVNMDVFDLKAYVMSYCCSGPDVQQTAVPYLVAANGLLVAVAGLFVLSSPGERQAGEARVARPRTINVAATTQLALQTMMWSCLALAAVAFVPWFDAHTVKLMTSEAPVVMTALSDAVLFASVALACAFFASQMQRAPSELTWAGLAITGGILFVIAGAEISETAQGCYSNGTILGFMSGGFGCFRGTTQYEFSAGTAVGWIALATSAIVAMLGLTLPIIEAFSRSNEQSERAGQW